MDGFQEAQQVRHNVQLRRTRFSCSVLVNLQRSRRDRGQVALNSVAERFSTPYTSVHPRVTVSAASCQAVVVRRFHAVCVFAPRANVNTLAHATLTRRDRDLTVTCGAATVRHCNATRRDRRPMYGPRNG